ncbi:mediator of RNA polymerase II transcription subunit 30 isoform X1 [Xiphias gladius]|uniref:mediator of RNA polymerase II transcription subunit 30 isoform X1 n=1 Tax=Xiphias gladius TaxID=8245 RepID=UPI001A98CFA6|nr:mediator of RNA polymerase II transcription subunit 30 isoform X1 [Xiphias gladius]XP_039976900.1 mediator of RNA polymerase II transcription subunit 30 isoform X1 [Xiphias gladius]XP_039976901.1 mediator of RNA polymerase II transcription subunit 30 isoform X1 [Xiphias gladius]XP_039976902.1 mediator of RNA polymerase II transcription subunit 30 isoform X1 [Xiphias gladius]
MTTPPLLSSFGGQPPSQQQQQQQQQQSQAARDVNTASLCRIGQETVQDIVLRTMEIFQLLRNMQLPNGVTYHPNTHQDRLGKLQEHLLMLSVLFRKLRLVYDKCNENCAGLDPIPPEQLIPFVEDDSSKHEDRSAGQSRPATEERREILEVNKFSFCIWVQFCHTQLWCRTMVAQQLRTNQRKISCNCQPLSDEFTISPLAGVSSESHEGH